jgi:Rod binding domain-containing protein
MTDLRVGAAGGSFTPDQVRERLRQAAHEFEGVFLTQLFKEMRASIQAESIDGGPGQEMFAGMLDESMAMEAGKRSVNGLGDALYRQLAARLGPEAKDGSTR